MRVDDDPSEDKDQLIGMSRAEATAFIEELRDHLKSRDSASLARMMWLPLDVPLPEGTSILIADARDLKENFDEVFSPTVISAVENEPLDDLADSWRGLMIGTGEVWISSLCVDSTGDSGDCQQFELKIIQLNP